MQDPGSELLRILLPRTRVNKEVRALLRALGLLRCRSIEQDRKQCYHD
jgi:hypothetical protein